MTNKDLINIVNATIKESGVTKTHIAKKLDVSRQGLDKILQKQSFAIDDANKILNILGFEVDNVSIKKIL